MPNRFSGPDANKPFFANARAWVAHRALDEAACDLKSRLEAELLLAFVLGRSRAWLYAHGDAALSADQARRFAELVDKRSAGRPIAYLLGQREFYGRQFQVDDAVLIPRPETELLIELILDLPLPDNARVVDIGTGSGCIALTLAAERPNWQVTATDICLEALAVAERNRQALRLESVRLLEGDLYQPLRSQQFDLVVSNPPYVADGDPHLEQGDLPSEPRLALSCPDRGTAILRRLADGAHEHLLPGGWLLVEHGHDQAAFVIELLHRSGFERVRSVDDLAGIARVALGLRPGQR
ncbi:MAG: peptide chain release factor N(5)-glutamine methyltransferase [Pseudomonadota bacterium]|nr:MAG: peptide chain release factor N(5)-glutamine methyltransferase [Pseudomonadota bacterium]